MGSDPAPGRRVVVGVVSKAFGIRGDVYVHPDPDVADEFPPGRTYAAAAGGHDSRPLTVASSRLHSGRRVVRFDGVTDREGAEALRGLVLSLDAEEVPLAPDTYWAADLVGQDVVDDRGEPLGVIEGILDGPAHDYLVIGRPDAGEVLVPVVEELVEIIGGRVVVRPIPGLLESGEGP